jgi:hypothetical protein
VKEAPGAPLRVNAMTTKKADTPKAAKQLERGRFARLLADGFEIEVTPSKRPPAAVKDEEQRPPKA